MDIFEHKLEKAFATFEETPKTSGEFQEGLPDTIVLHYTASGSANSAIQTFLDPDVPASAHIVIDRDGAITQMLPFNRIAWHAGKSTWQDRTSLNQYSIGIEIVNAGKLTKTGASWRSWFGKAYTENEVIEAVHKNETHPSWWHLYTEEQITAVQQLCKTLMKEYPIRVILGHDDISPGRKIDPGPAFPLEKLCDRLLKSNRRDKDPDNDSLITQTGIVDASALNMRSGPGTVYETIIKPLNKGTRVSIVSEEDKWLEVDVSIRGWVAKRYIKEER